MQRSWLSYGAQLLTVFFATTVLAGRVYAQNYWSVYGLSPELVNATFVDYAVMSPNVAVASALLAVSSVMMVALFSQPIPDIVGESNLRIALVMGQAALYAGLIAIGVPLEFNTSNWPSGTAGLVSGMGYIVSLGGVILTGQASQKIEKLRPRRRKNRFSLWLLGVPKVSFFAVVSVAIIGITIWGLADTAERFGANEAKMAYDRKPVVFLWLDSTQGFEDLPSVSSGGTQFFSVKIIEEAGGFVYVSPGIADSPSGTGSAKRRRLDVRAIPASRVISIRYDIDISPMGR